MLTLNDGRSELWQWDTGRTLTVDADCSQVHFSNKVFGRSIDVDVIDGVSIIPDILLQTDKDLNAWAFVGTAENGYTKISKTFKVNRRNKPAYYVFTPPDQTSLEEIKEKIDYLESIQDPDAIKNAVDDYLANNPIKVEEKDPTVPEWAKQPNPPDVKIPDNLPNPHALTFTGAVSCSYDGSAPVTINIPDSGGSASGFAVQSEAPADKSMLWIDPDDDAGGSASGFAVQSEAPDDKSVLWVDPDDTTGSDGTNGKSAYELAQDAGFEGTLEQWLESLKGADGAPGGDGQDGAPGKSAYQYAREAGYKGTEAEFAQKLAEDAPKAFYITVTGNAETGYTVDKTSAEIQAAYTAGCPLYAVYPDGDQMCLPLANADVDSWWLSFVATFYPYTYVLVLNASGDEITVEQAEAMEVTAEMVGALPADFVSGASVGQTVRITAVDEKGVPTVWEAVEMASGGEVWELLVDITLEEEVETIMTGLFERPQKKIRIALDSLAAETNTNYTPVTVWTDNVECNRHIKFYPPAMPMTKAITSVYEVEIFNDTEVKVSTSYADKPSDGKVANLTAATNSQLIWTPIDIYSKNIYPHITAVSISTYATWVVGTRLRVWGVAK